MLRNRPPGSFVVRDSRCYPGAFGLALKVNEVPPAVLATVKPGSEYLRGCCFATKSVEFVADSAAREPPVASFSASVRKL